MFSSLLLTSAYPTNCQLCFHGTFKKLVKGCLKTNNKKLTILWVRKCWFQSLTVPNWKIDLIWSFKETGTYLQSDIEQKICHGLLYSPLLSHGNSMSLYWLHFRIEKCVKSPGEFVWQASKDQAGLNVQYKQCSL